MEPPEFRAARQPADQELIQEPSTGWQFPVFRMLLEGNLYVKKPDSWMPFTPAVREAVEQAYWIAQERGENWIGLEHLMSTSIGRAAALHANLTKRFNRYGD